MQDIDAKLLASVTGGFTPKQAQKILQRRFPGAKVKVPADITADGRALQTERGNWRGSVETLKNAFEVVVTKAGHVMRDPLGQGDL